MNLDLNCINPYDPNKPHIKQQQWLEIDRSQPGKTRSHYTGGRGCAKTTSGIIVAFFAAYVWMRGLPGLWTEPTGKLCHDVFLREWKKIVPRELYRVDLGKMIVTCLHTGQNGGPDSTIDVRSRNVDNPHKEMNKGPNYGWGIDDEQAMKCGDNAVDKWEDIDAAVRIDTPWLFHDTLSTPKMNEYYALAHRPGHHLIEATSYDNPHNASCYASDLASQMNRARMEQEILGKWVTLEGLIYPEWSSEFHPAGNVLQHAAHDHDKPYFLFLDLGVATSVWLLVQKRSMGVGHPLWVATAEYTPHVKGDTDKMCRQIRKDYGSPVRVVCGHDVNRRSDGAADKPIHYIRKHFGGGVPITPISGWIADKEIQHSQVSYLIHDTMGRRRLVIAEHFRTHTDTTQRGIKKGFREVMTQYAWDSNDRLRIATFFPKPHRLEHMNDALCYGAVGCMAPPDHRYQKATAA